MDDQKHGIRYPYPDIPAEGHAVEVELKAEPKAERPDTVNTAIPAVTEPTGGDHAHH